MKHLLIAAALLITNSAMADQPGQEFTLEGINSRNEKCYLYVDRTGTDSNLPWRNRFFAEVRTSYDPHRTQTLVSQRTGELATINHFGQRTNTLKVRLPGKPNLASLQRADRFQGLLDQQWKPFFCIGLKLVK